MNDKADEVIEELFELFKKRFQNKLEGSMKGSEFVFNYVHLLHYKCRKINPMDHTKKMKKQKNNNKSYQ